MSNKTRGTHFKRLLLSFLVLYTAYSLIPTAVYAIGQMGSSDASTKTNREASASEPEPYSRAPQDSPSPENSSPAFLDGRRLPAPVSSTASKNSFFTVYDAGTKQLLKVSEQEFLVSALACEMDLSAPEEALKAQAVAIYTLYSYKRASGEKVNGADFACDSESWLVYVPKEAMQERWGENFEEYYAVLEAIAEDVCGQQLMINGRTACATYFAISAGNTETAENVWGPGLAYLQAVASPGDAFCDGYLSEAVFSADEIRDAAGQLAEKNFDFSGPEEDWFQNQERSPSGYTKSTQLGGVTLTGAELRSMLSLRSACLEISYADGSYTFTVRGWGHGVGMSQAGAVFLARQGADYREILNYYYPGLSLSI